MTLEQPAPTLQERWLAGDGAGVRIAVIDSGCREQPVDRSSLLHRIAIVRRYGHFEAADDRWGDEEYEQHGTHVCEIIRSVAPGAQVGTFTVRDRRHPEAVACAAQCAIALGYQILNCSFAGAGSAETLRIYKGWVDLAYTRGVHIVASGHNRRSSEVWPAWFPSVISVTKGELPEGVIAYAPPGAPPLVEFAACGKTLAPSTGLIGNSFAAPRVAALLARIVARQPAITPLEAKALLRRIGIAQHHARATNGAER